MGNAINGTHSIGTIQHTRQEDKPIARISSAIVPLLPDELARCIPTASQPRHDGTDDNSNKETGNDEEGSEPADKWKRVLCENDSEAASPRHDEVANKDLPSLRLQLGAVQLVRPEHHVADHDAVGSNGKHPRQTIQPASKPAANLAILGAGRH